LPPAAKVEGAAPTPWGLQPGQRVASRYTVLDLLGRGSVGVVLSAYDTRLDRRVALKLLHAHGASPESGARLLREAQAMARLSHPNVVAVYDAGTLDGDTVFIAMEYVAGGTLREWVKASSRGIPEVLKAYVAAGRGLAAAHTVGLIHRDFKPDNVLVGKDGRVRVTDFGLAREERSPTGPPMPEGVEEPERLWEASLTVRGAAVGTPKYMAPELWSGHAADVRTDVYSFCVALYEALHGEPPFPGTHKARLQAQREGRVAAPPEKTAVPTWLRRVVLWGLEPDAENRPPHMPALLRALEDDPRVRRRARLRAAAVTLLVVGIAGAVGWARSRSQEARCENAERHLTGIWDQDVRLNVRRALVGANVSYAPDVADRVDDELERYAHQWVGMRHEVCQALQEQGATQPRGLLLLEEYCLERRRSQLHALTTMLAQSPDANVVRQALQATAALPPLTYCADEKALTSAVPPPEDPEKRRRVEHLELRVDGLEASLIAGKYTEGATVAPGLIDDVTREGYVPLLARVLYLRGLIEDRQGHYAEAEKQFRQAATTAARARDVETLAQAWGSRFFEVGRRLGRTQEAEAMVPQVEDALELSVDDGVRASVLVNLGDVFANQGKYAEAQARLEQAILLRQKKLGPSHPQVAQAIKTLGNLLVDEGNYSEAKVRFEQALAIWEQAFGHAHPDVGMCLNNLGKTLMELGRYAEARAQLERALALFELSLGPEHLDLTLTLNNLGDALSAQGRYPEALAYFERALKTREKALGPNHPRVAASLVYVGSVGLAQGRYAEARAAMERALAIEEKALGPLNPQLAEVLDHLGEAFFAEGRYSEAQRHFERAVLLRKTGPSPLHPELGTSLIWLGRSLTMLHQPQAAQESLSKGRTLYEHLLGPTHPKLAVALLGSAELLRKQDRPGEAVPLLERALLLDQGGRRAELQWELAQALFEIGQERPRALVLGKQSWLEWHKRNHPRQEEVARWLNLHGVPLR